MPQFTNRHIVILPHADEYRRLYGVSAEQVFECLNAPDLHEGLSEGHYTAEKAFGEKHVYIYYYLTYPVSVIPLNARRLAPYAVVDFVGYTGPEDRPKSKRE